MWYMNFRAWQPEMRKRIDEVIGLEVTVPASDYGWTDPRAINHCRVQGNPHYDAGALQWHEGVEDKRAEVGSYGAPGVLDYLQALGGFVLRSESPYIIDVDDPELIKFGEDGIHERLTSMLGDLLKSKDTWPKGEEDVWAVGSKYFENMMFHTMEQGWTRQGLALEILRQQLGFPYEWSGARID